MNFYYQQAVIVDIDLDAMDVYGSKRKSAFGCNRLITLRG